MRIFYFWHPFSKNFLFSWKSISIKYCLLKEDNKFFGTKISIKSNLMETKFEHLGKILLSV